MTRAASLASQTVRGRLSGDYCQHSVDSAGILVQISAFANHCVNEKFNPGRTRRVVALWAVALIS